MRCLINYAWADSGTHGVDGSKALEKAAGVKAGDVMDCGLSDMACAAGRPRRVPVRLHLGGQFALGYELGPGPGQERQRLADPEGVASTPPHWATMLTACSATRASASARAGSMVNATPSCGLEVGCHCSSCNALVRRVTPPIGDPDRGGDR